MPTIFSVACDPNQTISAEETAPEAVVFASELKFFSAFLPVGELSQVESFALPVKLMLPLANEVSFLLSAVKILTAPSPFSPTIKFPSDNSTAQSTPESPKYVPPVTGFFILNELSNKNNILAGTSPSPDPGGIGFE